MKILLLGKTGQLGWELQRSLAPLGEVIALDRHSLNEFESAGCLAELSGTQPQPQAIARRRDSLTRLVDSV